MPRPRHASTLRLAAIDPDTLGREVSEAIARYAGRLAVPMSPGYEVHVGPCNGDTTIGMTAADLARYARDGVALDDVVETYALGLVAVLASPLDDRTAIPATLSRWLEGRVDVGTLDAYSTADQLALVITAALGREALATGKALTVGQLAALAGMDPDAVRLLGRKGEIAVKDGNVKAKEAQRWLTGRGVRA